MTRNFVGPNELDQRLNNSLVLSSRQMEWNGILMEEYQSPPTPGEHECPALSNHWLVFPLGQPVHLTQKRSDRLHESTVRKGDIVFTPAGQSSYWRAQGSDAYSCRRVMHIYVQPKFIAQIAETSEVDLDRIDLVNCFSKHDLPLHQVAMLLLAELQSGGMMGQLYVESLTQVLVIHLLRYYSTSTQTITSENRSLTHAQLKQAIDYIHTNLNQNLSLVQIAGVINTSPTYFASLFKRATGISPHQYVIQQRVERAKLLLETTDLPIADVASQVGFSSQSHLTQHCKSFTAMTPRQLSLNRKNLINLGKNLIEVDRLQ